jgi:hypothetical protein
MSWATKTDAQLHQVKFEAIPVFRWKGCGARHVALNRVPTVR